MDKPLTEEEVFEKGKRDFVNDLLGTLAGLDPLDEPSSSLQEKKEKLETVASEFLGFSYHEGGKTKKKSFEAKQRKLQGQFDSFSKQLEKERKAQIELTVETVSIEELKDNLKDSSSLLTNTLKYEAQELGKKVQEESEKASGLSVTAVFEETGQVKKFNEGELRSIVEGETEATDIGQLKLSDVESILEGRGYTLIEEAKGNLERPLNLLTLKQKRVSEALEAMEALLADQDQLGSFILPPEAVAFHTQEADKSVRSRDEFGNKLEGEGATATYPAFFSTRNDESEASSELSVLVKRANDSIIEAKEMGDTNLSTDAVNNLGKVLASEWAHKIPAGYKFKEGEAAIRRQTTRLVVFMDHKVDSSSPRKYQVLGIDQGEKSVYRVTFPSGHKRKNAQIKYAKLDEVMDMGLEPVASIRLTIPTNQLRLGMDAETYTKFQQDMLSDRTREGARVEEVQVTPQTESYNLEDEQAQGFLEVDEQEQLNLPGGEGVDAASYGTYQEAYEDTQTQTDDLKSDIENIIRRRAKDSGGYIDASTLPDAGDIPNMTGDWIDDSVSYFVEDQKIDDPDFIIDKLLREENNSEKVHIKQQADGVRSQTSEWYGSIAKKDQDPLIPFEIKIRERVINEINEIKQQQAREGLGVHDQGQEEGVNPLIGQAPVSEQEDGATRKNADQGALVALNGGMPVNEVDTQAVDLKPLALPIESLDSKASMDHQAEVEAYLRGSQPSLMSPSDEVDIGDTIEKQTIRENLENGKYNADILPERISRAIGATRNGRAILAAEKVARRSHEAIQQDYEEFSNKLRSEFLSESQAFGRAVRSYEDAALAKFAAKGRKLFFGERADELFEKWNSQGQKGGAENLVMYDEGSGRWIKVNTLAFHTTQLEFIQRIAIHNYLFPSVELKLEGYVRWPDGGELMPIVSQADVKHTGPLVTSNEAVRELVRRGGEKQERAQVVFDEGFSVEDYHDENVLRQENGSLAFIDTDIRLTPESKSKRLKEYAQPDEALNTNEKRSNILRQKLMDTGRTNVASLAEYLIEESEYDAGVTGEQIKLLELISNLRSTKDIDIKFETDFYSNDAGSYTSSNRLINLNIHTDDIERISRTLIHEAMHAVTVDAIHEYSRYGGAQSDRSYMNNETFNIIQSLEKLLWKARLQYEKESGQTFDWSSYEYDESGPMGSPVYGLGNLEEFVAQIFVDWDGVAPILTEIKRERRSTLDSIFSKLKNYIKRLLRSILGDFRNYYDDFAVAVGPEAFKFDESGYGEAVENLLELTFRLDQDYAKPQYETDEGRPIFLSPRQRVSRSIKTTSPAEISSDLGVADNSAVKPSVATWNYLENVYRNMFNHYNDMGLNNSGMDYDAFVKDIIRTSKSPKEKIKEINGALAEKGQAIVDEDLTLDKLTDKSHATNSIYELLRKLKSKIETNANKAAEEIAGQAEILQAKQNELNELIRQSTDISVISKAAEKHLRNSLNATRIQRQTNLSDDEKKVINVLAPESKNETGRAGELLSAAAGLNLDFKNESPDNIKSRIKNNPKVQSVLFSMFEDNTNLKDTAVDMMVNMGRSNQYLFDISFLRSPNTPSSETNSQIAKLRPKIQELLESALKSDSNALKKARDSIGLLGKSGRIAGRLLGKVAGHKAEVRKVKKSLEKQERAIAFRANVNSLINKELSAFEEALGVEWRETRMGEESKTQASLFKAVEGAQYLVPSSPDQTSDSLRKNGEVKIYTSVPRSTRQQSAEEYRKELKLDLARIDMWLKHPKRVKDAAYNHLARVYKELESEVLPAEYTAGQMQVMLKIFGTFNDEINRIGSPILNNLSRRITRYATESSKAEELQKETDAWTLAEREARRLLYGNSDPLSKKMFREEVYESSLSFFENHQEMIEDSDSVEDAINKTLLKLETHFKNSGGELAMKFNSSPNNEAWVAVEKLLRETGKISKAMMDMQEKMGLRVRQGNYFRRAIGAELFTVSRSISSEIESTIVDMRNLGWKQPIEEVAVKYSDTTKREELRADIKKRITSTIWANFVEPMVNLSGSKTMFRQASNNLVSAKGDVVAAFDGVAEGDLVTFAENLYRLTGGDVTGADALENQADYVDYIIGEFQDKFSTLNSNIEENYDAEKVTGNMGIGVRRPMMDARVASGFPSEWLNYTTYEEQSVLATVRAFAANAAFGENLRGFLKDIESTKEELNKHLTVRNKNISPAEMKKEAKEKFGPAGYKLVRNAQSNLEQVDKIGKQVASLVANDSKTYDFRTAHEILGALTGLVVQSVKTGIIDTSSIFAMPWAKYGANSKGFIESAKGINVLKEGVGGLFQMFGKQIDMDGGLHKIWNELHGGDPDALRPFNERLLSSLSRDVPDADRFDDTSIMGRAARRVTITGTKTARTVKELLTTGVMGFGERGDPLRQTTIKPLAPFTMMGQWMVAANTKNYWRSYRKLVTDAVSYLQSNPEAQSNLGFKFNHRHLKMPKEAFDHMLDSLAEHRMSLESLARKATDDIAAGDKPEIFTMDQYRALAILAQTDITKETSALTRPTWVFTTPLGRAANALVGWSLEKTADVERNFKLRDDVGDFSLRLAVRSMAPYMAILPASLAFVWMRKEWEEEVVGKRPNMLEFNSDLVKEGKVAEGLLLPMLDQTNRAGVFGILGDAVNSKWNPATGRDFHIENRVFFLSILLGGYDALATWVRSGTPLDWQSGFKPAIQSLGGGAYVESAQILQRTFGIDSDEVRITKRLNTDNWLRTIGRQQGLDVQIPSGARGVPNPVKPHFKNMVISALANDPVSFNRAKLDAEKELRRQGMTEDKIQSKIKENFRDYHPARRVFKRLPLEFEYQNLINAIPEEHRYEVNQALELYNSYCERLGVAPFRGKVEKKPTQTSRRSRSSSDIMRQLYGSRSGSYSGNTRNDILMKALRY